MGHADGTLRTNHGGRGVADTADQLRVRQARDWPETNGRRREGGGRSHLCIDHGLRNGQGLLSEEYRFVGCRLLAKERRSQRRQIAKQALSASQGRDLACLLQLR
ncbi:hypothetical protein D9M68_870420 [compost metagenome]